jgi:hypothetical protein
MVQIAGLHGSESRVGCGSREPNDFLLRVTVLLAADGRATGRLPQRWGSGGSKWGAGANALFRAELVAAIEDDLPRSGRNSRIDSAEIVRLTTQTTPEAATLWSTRTLATKAGISDTTVLRIWQTNGLKPHLVDSFKVSRDPKFAGKLENIVGLYMSPPEHALVLCCDERSQVQALDRTQP